MRTDASSRAPKPLAADRDVSVVVCSHNGATRLLTALASIEAALARADGMTAEIVCVDSASSDDTPVLLADWQARAGVDARTVRVDRKGLGRARNAGVQAARGAWIVFTDDDCTMREDYFTVFGGGVPPGVAFGGGEIRPAGADLDPRIANLAIDRTTKIPAGTLLRTGSIQGANMFFRREVFDDAGLFGETFGAGEAFPIEDIEMISRASLAGHAGLRMAGLVVFHDHGRLRGSLEADATARSYDFGRGAYYALMLGQGVARVRDHWPVPPRDADGLCRLAREFEGARAMLAELTANPDMLVPIALRRPPPARGLGRVRDLARRALSKIARRL